MMNNSRNKTENRLTGSIITIVILSLCLLFTTFALVYSSVSVEGNLFSTGRVKIDLNGGKAVINDGEFIFEPGMTVAKDFYVKNTGTCDIYYRIYFSNIDGGLADVLSVRICDGDKVLFEGTPSELNRDGVEAADDVLKIAEKRKLQIYFYFPSEAGNDAQNLFLTFDLVADATQVKNNENKEF